MKGLIFRELYLGRKRYATILAIWSIMFVLGILVRLSMNIGNLAMLPKEAFVQTDNVTYCIFTFLTPILTFMINSVSVETAGADLKSGWMRFQYSTPVREERYVLSKYIIILSATVLAFIPNVINAIVIGKLSGRPFSFEVFSVIVMEASVILCGTVIILLLTYCFHSMDKAMIVLIIFGIALYFLGVYLIDRYADAVSEMSFDTILGYLTGFCKKAAPIAPAADIAVIAVCYFLTVMTLKRREQ